MGWDAVKIDQSSKQAFEKRQTEHLFVIFSVLNISAIKKNVPKNQLNNEIW